MLRLKEALERRLAVVADHELRERDPASHLEALRTAAMELDREIAALPPSAAPMLRHYLERQSYPKALAWIESALG